MDRYVVILKCELEYYKKSLEDAQKEIKALKAFVDVVLAEWKKSVEQKHE